MIEISESAARVITRQLAKNSMAGGRPARRRQGRRLLGLQLRRSPGTRAARDTDQIFEGAGGAKVFVDPRSLKLLDGTVLDFDEHNLLATSFTLTNPHAKIARAAAENRFRREAGLRT